MSEYSLESVLSHISDFTNDAVIITNAEPICAPGPEIVYVNPTFTLMTGYSAEEAVGRNPRFLQGEGTSLAARRKIAVALSEWKPVVVELMNYKKSGAPFWTELSIVPITDSTGFCRFWMSLQRDTTQLRQNQRDLAIRSQAMDATSYAVAVSAFEGEKTRVIYGNRPYAQLFANGMDATTFDVLALIPAQRRREAASILQQVCSSRQPQHFEEMLSPRASPPFMARLLVEPVSTDLVSNGLLIRIKDITVEQARKLEMVQAQRLRAVGQLTGGVAHDFNNLLTIITHCAELILSEPDLPGEVRGLAETVAHTADLGADLTSQLLAFARKTPLHAEPIDLRRFLDRFAQVLMRTLPSSLRVRTEVQDEIMAAFADPAQLESALLNLAINARDALSNGGTVTIQARNVAIEDQAARDRDLNPGHYVEVSVIDDGPGMSQDVAQHAFEPFFTSKEVGKGSGLGLSMVYGFARQSGGEARIRSSPGAGARVDLLLPAAAEPGSRPPVFAASAEENSDLAPLSVLVVEDNPLVRAQAAEMVRRNGCTTFEASNAAEALDVLRSGSTIDLLFTDIVMPGGVSGVQLAAEAKRIKPDLKVLLTSGYSTAQVDLVNAVCEGAPLLKKPYKGKDLAAAIRRTAAGPGSSAGQLVEGSSGDPLNARSA